MHLFLPEKKLTTASVNMLQQQAFENSSQANIISAVSSGRILLANKAACKMLGYSKKDLLLQDLSTVLDLKGQRFKKFLTQNAGDQLFQIPVSAIKKNGQLISCEISAALFTGEHGIVKAISNITDRSQNELAQKTVDVKKAKKVEDNIAVARSKQKQLDNKKDKKVAQDIAVAKSKQQKIDVRKDKIVANNIVVAQAKADAKLTKNNQWIKYIAKASYDIMWDWDIASDKIYVGDSVEEVFGYMLTNNTADFSDFKNCLLPAESSRVESKIKRALASGNNKWSDFFKFLRYDGSVASVTSRASIVRDSKGKALRMIGALQDLSKQHALEKNLKEEASNKDVDAFLLATKLSFDVIWDWNLGSNDLFIGEGFEELFGYAVANNKAKINDWTDHLHAGDKQNVEQGLLCAIKSVDSQWEQSYRLVRADGSVANIFSRASIIRHQDGTAYRIIGVIQDLSLQKELQQKLDSEIKTQRKQLSRFNQSVKVLDEKMELEISLKEKQIADAIEDAKDTERADIGKELHDNINQLLGASKLYIDMAKKGGGKSAMYLTQSSRYTLEAIEEIRKLTKGLTTDIIKNLGLGEAIENIAQDTMEMSQLKINCSLDSFQEKMVPDKFKLNLYRIVQEQLTNILKHARATTVAIDLLQNTRYIILSITDNGVGFDVSSKQKGIGLANIKSRAATYNGRAEFVSKNGEGCVLTIFFPAKIAS